MTMINVKANDIPEFLKKSELYENIIGMKNVDDCSDESGSDEDVEIPVLKKYYITELKLNSVTGKESFAGVEKNLEQLGEIFEILRYWMVKEIPHEIYSYFEKNTHLNILLKNLPFKPGKTPYTDFFEKFKYFPHIEDFHILIDLCGEKSMVEMAIKNRFNLIKYAHTQNYPWNPIITKYIAKNGNLQCLEYVHNNGCNFDPNTCRYAAKNNNLDCLKYAYLGGCPINKECYLEAAMNGSLECLKYIYKCNNHDVSNPLPKNFVKRLFVEDYNDSQFTNTHPRQKHKSYCIFNGTKQPSSEKTLRIIECIKFLISKGANYDIYMWRIAICGENLELLKFIYESFVETNIFEISDNPLIIFSNYRKSDAFKYIFGKGYFTKLTNTEKKLVIENLLKRDKIECLKLIHESGYRFDDKIYDQCINCRRYFSFIVMKTTSSR